MKYSTANINSVWGSLLVEELIRHGIDRFFISPGSRSTPLVAAVADNPRATCSVHFDERGAAFRALGYARGSGKPAAIICTSGTAAANYYPAIIEASVDCLPMIVLTADRPPELRNTGANQTIDQVELYGKYVRQFVDLPCPSTDVPVAGLLDTIDDLVRTATSSPRGPVHLNCLFREPLAPIPSGENLSDYLAGLDKRDTPKVRISVPATRDIERAAALIRESRRGLLVIGQLRSNDQQNALLRLIQKLNWPVFADVQSGLSLSGHHQMISHYDLELASRSFCDIIKPDLVLQIGDRTVSKRLLQFLEQTAPTHHLLVLDHSLPYDPAHTVTDRIEADIPGFCDSLCAILGSAGPSELLGRLQTTSHIVEAQIDQSLASARHLTECAAAKIITAELPADHGLFVASSMPIRLMDMFADPTGRVIRVGANRGASGIDGTLASAIGFAEGLARPVTLVIGDLALLHDLNSLAMLATAGQPVTIVVLNNDGGGIFEHLPIAQFPELLERFFVAPHGLTFESAAALFNVPYRHVAAAHDLSKEYIGSTTAPKAGIIEVTIDREANRQFHDRLITRLTEKLDSLV
jgi:2-succinyl-5-enolpyruvyl-6-hydroxy-3-cyclohexene-1-carboxylate synthase